MLYKKDFFQFFGVLALLGTLGASPVAGADGKVLPGHVPRELSTLAASGRLPATSQLWLALGLPLRNPAGMDNFLAQVYDPASPNYRHFLTPDELTARFGPTEADYEAVKQFALTNGLTTAVTHGNRLVLDVTGPAAAVEKAFHITLQTYQHPTEARTFYAPDKDPSVAASLPLADVQGLSDFSRGHPKFVRRNGVDAVNKSGSAPDGKGALFGNDFRSAYVPGTALTGAGQAVGLFQDDGYYPSDIAKYAKLAGNGRTNIVIQTVLIDNYNGIPTSAGNDEVSLDIEMSMAMAPGLSRIVLFEGNPTNYIWNDILNTMAASNMIKNLSCSWGWNGGPSNTTDVIFKTMQAQGQTFYDASGDVAAFTVGASSVNGVDSLNPNLYNAPSSCPYIIQVGGTTMTMNGTGASYASETVWNWGGGSASSGGVSSFYTIPTWQTNISMSANLGSTSQRNIPDVAATADNVYVISGGSGASNVLGGTSCAAPLWAGLTALVNQQYAINTGVASNSVGFLNPALYAIGKGQNPAYSYAACYHDITSGNNFGSSSPTNYPAVAGYDLCTGWGTPSGTNLINALATPPDVLGINPGAGFSAGGLPGGPFSPSSQIFTLTNSSASSLNWMALNTSAWLTLSTSSGTLPASGQTSLIASLTAAANSLTVGSYAATVGFSNLTSHVVQNRQFNLTISDPLVLLTSTGFTASGPLGGPFNLSSQAIVFTNLSASVVPWSLINTSAWLAVSASSGSLAGNSAVSVTVATNAGTANLSSGNYNATLVLSNQSSHLAQSLVFAASVGQSIVQNGAFETGDLTGWMQSGNTAYTSVISGNASYVHGGSYGLQAGPSTTMGYITQNLATSPGQMYLLSFWFSNPSSGTTEQLQASWNGASVYSLANPPVLAWTNKTFIVTATSSSTPLQFGLRNDPSYFGLDDISVTPLSPPTITQQPASQTNFLGNNVVFTATANGMPPLAYQWRTNGVNLVNGAGVSGATTNVLTLTSITTGSAGNYTCVVTNAYGAATSQVASLTVTLQTPPTLTAPAVGTNGIFTINYSAVEGFTYILQTTTNLSSSGLWASVATNVPAVSGVTNFTDPDAAIYWLRFYRIKIGP